LGGRYDVGLDNRIMPEVAARVLRCRLQPRKITPAVRVLQEALMYMLDDMVILGVGVATLSQRRLQENEGRLLKLLAGLVMLGLGIYLLIPASA